MLLSSRVRIRVSIWLVSGFAHVFVLLSGLILPYLINTQLSARMLTVRSFDLFSFHRYYAEYLLLLSYLVFVICIVIYFACCCYLLTIRDVNSFCLPCQDFFLTEILFFVDLYILIGCWHAMTHYHRVTDCLVDIVRFK